MHAPAHTHAQERPTTNDATCGPPAWLTGRLHDRGIRSVRSPPRRALLLATTPIATPLQGGHPERSDLLFLKLLRKREREELRAIEKRRKRKEAEEEKKQKKYRKRQRAPYKENKKTQFLLVFLLLAVS